eukprot:comp23593_c0_seq1/m.40045 comp23593_c0_seq1/g.40045  ORF comp23593_c0_seq1/g.40045 comp23593_c0_seq1/m.40045 type:complete len:1411 (-) comp23593_c0_seq1:334-4566(-)
MFCAYKTTHQSSAVEFCLEAHLTGPNDNNLVVARTDVLEIYTLRERLSKDGGAQSEDGHGTAHLEVVGRYPLHGNVVGLAAAAMGPGKTDLLFLACRDAKISVLSFNPAQHHIQTESLHWFEDDDLRKGRVTHTTPTLLRTDPSHRCAVLLCHGVNLAVLGIRRPGDLEETLEDNVDGPDSLGLVRASYMVNLHSLKEIDENINIRFVHDICFLEGYFEPTLLILYESVTTWAGRVSVRSDTVSILALSLNSITREHHVVWQMHNLPFDCRRLQAVPRPIGGVLVFGANVIIYLNQSTPTYAVSLNEFAKSAHYSLEEQEGVVMTVDQSRSTFIAPDRLVLATKSGDIYVMTLMTDGRNVKKLEIHKAGASVLPHAVCTLTGNYLFIGSRMGDSLLISYQEKLPMDTPKVLQKATEKETKRRRLTEGDLDDDLFIYDTAYGDTQQETTALSFKVCDSLLNIGPVRQLCLGEPAFLSEEYISKERHDLEIVTCSGYGKNGSLCVLQRSIRPQVLSTFNLGQNRAMWTLHDVPSPVADPSSLRDAATDLPYHQYLVISSEDDTMALSTGEELKEIESPGLMTFGPTVHMGNLGGVKYIVQLHEDGLVLLEGMRQVHHATFDGNGYCIGGWTVDPYLCVLLSDGTLQLYVLDPAQPSLEPVNVDLPEGTFVTAACLYRDTKSLMARKPEDELPSRPKRPHEPEMEEEDEDFLLYGESAAKSLKEEEGEKSKADTGSSPADIDVLYLAVCTSTGHLIVKTVPDMDERFHVVDFADGCILLRDSVVHREATTPEEDTPIVVEVAIYGLGATGDYLYLMAITDGGDLFIYKGFTYVDPLESLTQGAGSRLTVRFRKVQHEILLRKMEDVKDAWAYGAPMKNGAGLMMDKETDKDFNERLEDAVRDHRRKLFPFSNVSGYNGVFVAGDRPNWILCTRKGLRIHPMHVESRVLWFTPFHNVNCQNGFLYFNENHDLRICQLNQYLLYDSPWPCRKVPIRRTPHFVAFHVESKTYTMAVSTERPVTEKARSTNETVDRIPEPLPKKPRYIYATDPKFDIILITPLTWEVIHTHELEMFEHVTSMETVTLRSGETASGLKAFVAASTVKAMGEDTSARGRVLLFEVIEVVPEPDRPQTNHKLKCVYNQEQKGPVTALTHACGQLITAIGQKIFIWAFMDGNLVGRAFIDTMMYIHRLIPAKSFILAADIFNSIYLLRYQEEDKSLSLITKDYDRLPVMTAGYIVDDFALGMVVTDTWGNYMIFHYMPEDPESRGGTRLLRKADFHVGSRINSMVRIGMRDLPGDKFAKVRHLNYIGTMDGGLGFVAPVAEKTYRRLNTLQSRMVTQLLHVAGLNPRAHRLYQPMASTGSNPCRNILDTDLLGLYAYLPASLRKDLARQIGTSPGQILQDLQEMEHATALL